MAYTVSNTVSVFGNMRVAMLSITADAATQTVETGLKNVICHALGPKSLTSGAIKIYANSNASGVLSAGVLGISGATSGDVFFVTVFGT